MDSFNLRIIANPYLLKKKKQNSQNNSQIENENNELLYKYLSIKYKEMYINPVLYYNIINVIDKSINDYEITLVVKEIIDGLIISSTSSVNVNNNFKI